MGLNEIFSFFGILVVFGALLFLAYVTTRYVGSKASKALKGKYISIADTVNIGLDKQLHLVKVGESYFLISSSGKNIGFLAEVDINSETVDEVGESNNLFDFKSLFEKYVQTFKGAGKKEDKEDKSGLDVATEGEMFKSNLKKLKTINLRTGNQEKNDGDENTNEN